jgi:hypothetical protein
MPFLWFKATFSVKRQSSKPSTKELLENKAEHCGVLLLIN